jgi:hypothetical protein
MKLLAAAGLTIILALAYLPAHDVYLAGDDFAWLDESYQVWSHPLSVLEPINNFFRPLIKLSFLLDYTLCGTATSCYMATNIAVHILNALLLLALLRRHCKGPAPALFGAVSFGLSPLHSEAVLWASGRPSSMLLPFMLGALLVLDGKRSDALARRLGFLVLTVGALGTKETWIILPPLATSYLMAQGVTPVTALRRTAAAWLLVCAYMLVFFVLPVLLDTSTPAHYTGLDIPYAMHKTSLLLLKLVALDTLITGPVTAPLVVTTVAALTLAWLIRRKHYLALWGAGWTFLSLVIYAPMPYAPLRYNYLPVAGFWIMVVAVLGAEWPAIRAALRLRAALAMMILVTLALGYWSWLAVSLQREIGDFWRYGSGYRQLVTMYTEVDRDIPRTRPLVLINAGQRRVIEEVAGAVQGEQKIIFVRESGLWQLIYFPALVNFCSTPFEQRLHQVPDHEALSLLAGPYTLLVFDDRGFHLTDEPGSSIEEHLRRHRSLPPQVTVYRFFREQ